MKAQKIGVPDETAPSPPKRDFLRRGAFFAPDSTRVGYIIHADFWDFKALHGSTSRLAHSVFFFVVVVSSGAVIKEGLQPLGQTCQRLLPPKTPLTSTPASTTSPARSQPQHLHPAPPPPPPRSARDLAVKLAWEFSAEKVIREEKLPLFFPFIKPSVNLTSMHLKSVNSL